MQSIIETKELSFLLNTRTNIIILFTPWGEARWQKKNPKDSLWYAWYVTMHGMVNAFWLHFNKYTKMNSHKNDFFRVSTVLIQSDYVTDDKRLLSTCILNNISIAAFLTVLFGPLSFLGIHQHDQDPLYHLSKIEKKVYLM